MLSESSKWELGFVHYISEFTISRFVISRFECTQIVMETNHARKNIHYYYIPTWNIQQILTLTLNFKISQVKKKRKIITIIKINNNGFFYNFFLNNWIDFIMAHVKTHERQHRQKCTNLQKKIYGVCSYISLKK